MNQPRWFRIFGLQGWWSWKLFRLLRKIKPDFIYLIGYEEHLVSLEAGFFRRVFSPGAKIACFTMRGTPYHFKSGHPMRYLFKKATFHLTNRIFDAILCHYPEGKRLIVNQRRFKKPVYLQTQIGVDRDIFHPDINSRKEIRARYGIQDEFVFGSAGRIDSRKGVFDILEALPEAGNWRCLIIGGGRDFEKLQQKIREKKLEDQIITPGYIQAGPEIARHLNALDCFVHVPRSTPAWVDTFPGVIPEAMATALPIIGSDSGAVPYQLGDAGIIVPEGESAALNKAMRQVMSDPIKAKDLGKRLYARVQHTFEIRHLTRCFNLVMRDILADRWDEGHEDQVNFRFTPRQKTR